jgi:tetratricopeptide (TPR) repeat protein
MEQAAQAKEQANAHFQAGRWRVAIVGYLAGVWFLKRGDPPCPQLIACEEAGLDGVAAALGAGTGTGVDVLDGMDGVATLRLALHLNLAQAALKLSEWAIARVACEHALASEATHPKALYRLAKAHEGEGDLKQASSSLTRLLKIEPNNADARKVHDAIKKRTEKERKAYAGVFTRALGDNAKGDGLYTAAEESRDQAEALEREANKPPYTVTTGEQIQAMSDGEQAAWLDEVNKGLES